MGPSTLHLLWLQHFFPLLSLSYTCTIAAGRTLNVALQHGALILPAPRFFRPVSCHLCIQARQLCSAASNDRLQRAWRTAGAIAAHVAAGSAVRVCMWLLQQHTTAQCSGPHQGPAAAIH